MALICKQLRPIDIPAQESVCKGPNLHRCHIRQCVAEDPGLMHRVKKVAFRTRLQSGMSHRVYNHHFFTRNNSCLDLSRQCHAPRLKNECRPLFSSPNQNQTSCPCWYTRSAFPVPMCPCIFGAYKGIIKYIFCSMEQSETRSSRYEKLCAPKTAFA